MNAATNLGFIVMAWVMWARLAPGPVLARFLCVLLAAIGVGSFLFHTFATVWASTADVVPIMLFILVYLFAINRDVLDWPIWAALLGVAGFIPYAFGVTFVLNEIPFFRISNFYWAVPLLILAYTVVIHPRDPVLAKGFIMGAAILTVSISVRSLDNLACGQIPIGTHFVWHLLNAIMLGWMIETYRKHLAMRG